MISQPGQFLDQPVSYSILIHAAGKWFAIRAGYGIVESIETAKAAGIGAWQSQAILRGYELLGKYLGFFTDKVEVGADQKLIEQLLLGRKRATGLLRER